MSYKIGIVGRGFVGSAMFENFKECFEVASWDIDEKKRTIDSFESFVNWSEIIFVCVPTPMNEDGSCNVSIVEDVVNKIANVDRRKYVVIKSTVTPGTTERLAQDHGMVIGFNPEFLTEANHINDFKNQSLIIVGADDSGIGTVLSQIYYEFNHHVDNKSHIVQRTTKEAEMFKYLANCFLATKVIFANEFKKLCDQSGVDYNNISEIAKLDDRLGHTHWKVPGPDGRMGFGGSCFPKDTAAMLAYADQMGATLWLLTEATYINEEVRGETFHKLQIVE